MKEKTILLINDDVDDSMSQQKQLPDNLDVQLCSQQQARWMNKFDFDIIIVDNDQNDLKESKGQETLECIMEKGTKAKIFFTSFQPGWVKAEIHQMRQVQVVKTDELLQSLQVSFGFKIKEKPEERKPEPQTTLIISYNNVSGYQEGVYSNGKLIILSFDKHAGEQAQVVLRQKLLDIYKQFEWRADRDIIKNVFVYDGKNGGKWPSRLAAVLGHDIRIKVQLLACHCDWDRKLKFANNCYIDLYKCSCGGHDELGIIADLILEIKRPDVHYSKNVVPMSIIENGAEKYSA